MTKERAYLVASQWGSYLHSGDPGACFYGFRYNDGRPTDEGRRRACLAHAERCEKIALAQGDTNDARDLRSFRDWMAAAPLAPAAS